MGTFSVQILGSSSATPAFSRNPSAQIVNYHDRYYLIDCGEGTQMQCLRYGLRYARLDGIFISHLHGDHILGLAGLMASMSILERTEPLPIYAPSQLKDILETTFKHSDTYLKYEVQYHSLQDFTPGETIFETEKLAVSTVPLTHRTFCRGFVFREQNKRRKFNFFKAKDLDVPREYFHLLKQENDVTLPDGRIIKADDVLMDRDAPLAYAYCSDTQYEEAILPFLNDVTVLYHEATFMEAMAKRAVETCHSTAKQAGRIAKAAGVKQLLVGHFSARYRDLQPLLDEAREEFPATELALEGRVFDLRQFTGKEEPGV